MAQGTRFWADATLDSWINDWSRETQHELGLVVSSATYVTTATDSSYQYSVFGTDIVRPNFVFWDTRRLVPRNREDLAQLNVDWVTSTNSSPTTIIPVDDDTFEVYPTPTGTGTIYVEYIPELALATATDTTSIPTWATFTCPFYVAFRAYRADGPLNDLNKSNIYKSLYIQKLTKLKSICAHTTPSHFPGLVPGGHFQSDVLTARRYPRS